MAKWLKITIWVLYGITTMSLILNGVTALGFLFAILVGVLIWKLTSNNDSKTKDKDND